ncbi:MAG TPA: hypothetical protein VIG33_03710, partial [Pseudobdellovibrionaceae bacterium]
NESYNASRWVESIGSSPKGLIFEHPAVKSPHMMMLVENFNMQHFSKVYDEYKELINETYEVFPTSANKEFTDSLPTYCAELFSKPLVTVRAA